MSEVDQLERISKELHKVLVQLCGGSVTADYIQKLLKGKVIYLSKPDTHDFEIRCAPAIYKRFQSEVDHLLRLESDMGIERTFSSIIELARWIQIKMEETCSLDLRTSQSGIIHAVSPARSQLLRDLGKRPCPFCHHWLKGEKGVWWHVSQYHHSQHESAKAQAVATRISNAVIVYNGGYTRFCPKVIQNSDPCRSENSSPFELAKRGDLLGIRQKVNEGWDPKAIDSRGASALLWAAGGGHINLVQYLVEECSCDPEWQQLGRRAFRGRTALHWASRNGHLDVVKYLVQDCNVSLENKTSDGTTAFCWASWQAHMDIMTYLHDNGCNISSKNKFGCNAALWAAQGNGDINTLEWLDSVGCSIYLVNSNGHGVLHKAAQRGREDIVRWFCDRIQDPTIFCQADTEGYTPSKLAEIEGFDAIASFLKSFEGFSK